jgi:aldehyde dehydrogenase (NAD+)
MAAPATYRTGHWIDGAFDGGDCIDGARIEVVDPATEEVLAAVPAGTAADVDRAVAAARAAFPGWSQTPVQARAAAVGRISDGLAARRDEIAAVITAEMGSPTTFARKVQATMPRATSAGVAKLAADFPWTEEIGNSLVVREPVGVVGAITPWNYPLHQIVAKVAPALVAGCSVVLKPSEIAPLTAGILAEIVSAAGVPGGVYNVVHGYGPTVGEALAAHPGVDMMSFTGSARAGRRVSEISAATIKRVALELGGKSANVVLGDADLATAVKLGVAQCFLNGGQTCSAWTRMLVPADRHDEAVEMAVAAAAKYTVGDPTDGATRIGPMASAAQRQRVAGYLGKGVDSGATVAFGGPGPVDGLERGFYVRPTVFANVAPDAVIAQEEIFGPVLSVIPYRDDDEAVEIANSTVYGLAGAVFGEPEHALEIARRLRTGQVDVNGGAFNPLAPFGGYKQSGNGRELGRFGLEEFCEVKSIQR